MIIEKCLRYFCQMTLSEDKKGKSKVIGVNPFA